MNRSKFIGGAALCAAAGLWIGGAVATDAVAADNWRLCEPDYAVLVPDSSLWGNDNHHKIVNEHFHVLESPKSGDLLAFWTQESFEGSDDMHISFARSRDGGRTWTAPRIFRGSPKPGSGVANAVWQLPMFAKSGRLYCFWNEREKPGRGMGVGYMKGAYSDDDGETWSEPKVVWQPQLWCSWQRPLRLAKDGRYLTAVSIADEATAKTCFMRFENLDDDPEIGAVKISLFMDGDKTLDGEEASIVKLPDGRLFAVMRSKFGVPLWTVSADGGETWSDAKAVVDANGRTIAHPRSPCPIYDLGGEAAGSGNYFALFCDAFDAKVGQWEGRGPLYRYEGTFDAKGGQPVRFTKREILLKRSGSSHYGNSCYSSFTKRGDERVLWFPDNKFYLLGKIIHGSPTVMNATSSRGETLEWFRHEMYGRAPVGRPPDEEIGKDSVSFAGGRFKIRIHCSLPKGADKDRPAPVFLFGDHFNAANSSTHTWEYPGVPTNSITARGYAYVRINFNDVAPNTYCRLGQGGDWSNGVHSVYGVGKGDDWGTLSAWAWALSRTMDWIETRPELNAREVAVLGHSRGGKTALWAAAQDERFAMGVSSGSGTGGARLLGLEIPEAEHIRDMMDGAIYFWFCPNFRKYIGREAAMPHDADDLIGLIAPRLAYVASGSEDDWAGPRGEFEAARRASRHWESFGKTGLALKTFGPPGTVSHEGSIGYHYHKGPHELNAYDWARLMDFADRHFHPSKVREALP